MARFFASSPSRNACIRAGGTTEDGAITLEDVECIAACTEAPAIQVNYRYFHNVTADDLDQIIAEARAGTLSDRVPDHGTLGKVRQDVSADELANVTPPEQQTIRPWIARHQAAVFVRKSLGTLRYYRHLGIGRASD